MVTFSLNLWEKVSFNCSPITQRNDKTKRSSEPFSLSKNVQTEGKKYKAFPLNTELLGDDVKSEGKNDACFVSSAGMQQQADLHGVFADSP